MTTIPLITTYAVSSLCGEYFNEERYEYEFSVKTAVITATIASIAIQYATNIYLAAPLLIASLSPAFFKEIGYGAITPFIDPHAGVILLTTHGIANGSPKQLATYTVTTMLTFLFTLA